MNKPKVELKNVKTFRGHDGVGLDADIWINGIKCMHTFDDARGGECEYQPYTYNNPKAEEVKANIKLLEDYIKTLPKVKSTIDDFEFDMNLDMFINDILMEKEKEKNRKKMAKLCATAIVFGNMEKEYRWYNFNRPLTTVPLAELQKYTNMAKAQLKKGEVILNDNLVSLGVNL